MKVRFNFALGFALKFEFNGRKESKQLHQIVNITQTIKKHTILILFIFECVVVVELPTIVAS